MIRALAFVALTATSAGAETILSAEYAAPTDRYAHGVLGDAIEWGALRITTDGTDPGALGQPSARRPMAYVIELPLERVFEDIAPRLVDLDNDGTNEVVVVETHVRQGAQLAVYDETGKIAATPYIGRTNRWLAPIGAADLDGDGFVEVAYIDRPHLAKTLQVWRFVENALQPVVDLGGLTNHSIGEDFISGGIRECGQGPEMITANADWSQVMAIVLKDGVLTTRAIGAYRDQGAFAAAQRCETLPD